MPKQGEGFEEAAMIKGGVIFFGEKIDIEPGVFGCGRALEGDEVEVVDFGAKEELRLSFL